MTFFIANFTTGLTRRDWKVISGLERVGDTGVTQKVGPLRKVQNQKGSVSDRTVSDKFGV